VNEIEFGKNSCFKRKHFKTLILKFSVPKKIIKKKINIMQSDFVMKNAQFF